MSFLEKVKSVAKYAVYVVVIIMAIALGLTIWQRSRDLKSANEAMETYKRQIAGQLTEKERELEQLNVKLGLSSSKLMTAEALAEQYKKDKETVDKDFEAFKKKHDLQMQSYSKTILELKNELNGGITHVDILKCLSAAKKVADNIVANSPKVEIHGEDTEQPIIKYSWESLDHRFKLEDPNIFASGNEKFYYVQKFALFVETFKQNNGYLKTQRLELNEVMEDGKNPDGTIKYKIIHPVEIVSSNFNYTAEPPIAIKEKVLVSNLIASINAGAVGFTPDFKVHGFVGVGVEWLNLHWIKLRVSNQIMIDLTNPSQTGISLNLEYRPTIVNKNFNLAVSAGVMTPFNANILREYYPLLGLIFYIIDL